MLSFRPLLAAAVLALWMPAAAQAATISYSDTFGSVSLAGTNPIDTVTLNQFDPSLGTLDLVTITLQATITGDTTITRSGATGTATPGGNTTRNLTLNLSPAGLTNLVMGNVDVWDTQFSAAPGTQVRTRTQNVDVSGSLFVDEASALAFFIGLGTFQLDLLGAIINNIIFPSDGATWNITAMTGFAVGSVTVKYEFSMAEEPSEVPEPAVLGLVGLGLLGLGLVAHRRRRAA